MSKFLDDIGLTLLWSKIKQYVSDKVPNFIMGSSIGSGPYTIEMSEEEEGDLSASQVSYNNTSTDMTSSNVQEAITELYGLSATSGVNLPKVTITIDGSLGLWNFMFITENGVQTAKWEGSNGSTTKQIEVFAGLPVIAYLIGKYLTHGINPVSGNYSMQYIDNISDGKKDHAALVLYPFSDCEIEVYASGGSG